jgi:hypothetical protein
MLFESLSWMDVQRYLERDDRVVVITGACEQQGYLSLLTDVSIPVEIGRQVCDRDVPSAASAADFRDALGDDSFGGPYQASGEVMDRILAAAVEAMADALREL